MTDDYHFSQIDCFRDNVKSILAKTKYPTVDGPTEELPFDIADVDIKIVIVSFK